MWPHWTIFKSSWEQIFFQKLSEYKVTFGAIFRPLAILVILKLFQIVCFIISKWKKILAYVLNSLSTEIKFSFQKMYFFKSSDVDESLKICHFLWKIGPKCQLWNSSWARNSRKSKKSCRSQFNSILAKFTTKSDKRSVQIGSSSS